MEQGTVEWHLARCGRFTASRADQLMARTKSGPSASRANLLALLAIERLTGQPVETYQNDAMRRGSELEPEARAAYEARCGVLVEEVGLLVHPDHDCIACSPDGLVGDAGMLEIKSPSAMAKHLDAIRNGSHAVEYRWQLQHQLMVSGRSWVDIASYDPRWPDHLQLAITRVHRDESAISALRDECLRADAEVEAIVAELRRL